MPRKTKINNRLYAVIRGGIIGYMNTLARLKVINRDRVPAEGGLIIACNHIAAADPFLMGSTVPRELWFMAKKELFEPFIMGNIVKRLNAFPVDRWGLDLKVIKLSLSMLKDGKALIMFPEGTRSDDYRLMKLKEGVAMLAHKAGVPIQPVYIKNSKRAWFNFVTGKRFVVEYGEPITAEWIKGHPSTKEGYAEITQELYQRMLKLQDSVDQQ